MDLVYSVTSTGGVLPVHLVYCGAHTGRFADGGGLNLQNLGRSGPAGRIRNVLVAEPGHTFIIADLCQIRSVVGPSWGIVSGQASRKGVAEGQRDGDGPDQP